MTDTWQDLERRFHEIGSRPGKVVLDFYEGTADERIQWTLTGPVAEGECRISLVGGNPAEAQKNPKPPHYGTDHYSVDEVQELMRRAGRLLIPDNPANIWEGADLFLKITVQNLRSHVCEEHGMRFFPNAGRTLGIMAGLLVEGTHVRLRVDGQLLNRKKDELAITRKRLFTKEEINIIAAKIMEISAPPTTEWLLENGFPTDIHRAVRVALAEVGDFATDQEIDELPMDNIRTLLQMSVDRRQWHNKQQQTVEWVGPKQKSVWKRELRLADSTFKDLRKNNPDAFQAGSNNQQCSIRKDFYETLKREADSKPEIRPKKRRKKPTKAE